MSTIDLRLSVRRSLLLVVDIQERLLPAIHPADADRLVKNTRLLLEAAQLFEVPRLVTEQYPKGLGPTIAPIAQVLGGARPLEKMSFSALGEPHVREALDETGRDHIVLCGTEAHVCVLQTALDLRAGGLTVFVAADAIGSRDPLCREVALTQLQQAGAIITTAESAAFQWCKRADEPQFKALSRLVK